MSTDSNELDGGDDLGGSSNQYVTFSVAGEMFAVPMAPVQEIIRVPEVAHLPLAPPALEGLANLRGRVLPIINLRRLFACEARAHDDTTRALVIQIGQPLGFVVDRVASVISVDAGEIEAADSIQSVVGSACLTGVIKRAQPDGRTEMLLVVDFAQLIEGQFSGIGQGGAETRAGASASGASASANDDAEEAAANDELRLVSFAVAEQEYALDIADVEEIVQLPEQVSALPNTPGHVLGVISLRQRLLPLVSLRALFGMESLPYTEQQRIVVTALPGGLRVGLVTDSVKEVLSVPRAQTEAMPGLLAADEQLQEFTSICRLDDGKRLVSIIAADKLLKLPDIDSALQAAQRAAAGATTPDGATDMQNDSDDSDKDNRGKDGREYWLELDIQPLRDEADLITGFMAVETDTTVRRKAESDAQRSAAQLRSALDTQAQFIATISHELRTPLQTINGFSDLGRIVAMPHPELKGMFDDIHAGGLRMLKLVNGLLDVSKIDGTLGSIKLQRADVAALAVDVTRELANLADARDLRIALPEPCPRLMADVDGFRWQQVVRNVLANAIRFAPVGSLIELGLQDHGAAGVEITVRDRGPGIPVGELEVIFDAFVQSSLTRDDSGGTGLGLAIARKIMVAHGGSIQAGNAPDGGALMRMKLPAAQPVAAPPLAAPEEALAA